MECRYCGRQTVNTEVCASCSAVEYDLRKYAEPQGKLNIVHNRSWGIRKADIDYNGAPING